MLCQSDIEKVISNPFYVPVPVVPTQEGPRGIKYDFNDGARVLLPKGEWFVRLIDDDTDNVLFEGNVDEGIVCSTKKYYIKHRIKVWERFKENAIFDVRMDLIGKPVLIKCPVGTIGDIVAWMTYIDRFQRKHRCKLEVTMQAKMAELFEEQYPNILFTHLPGEAQTKSPYASYRMGLFFDGDTNYQPVDFRTIGLHTTAGYILGVDTTPQAPRVKLGSKRTIQSPYVCIACKGSSQNKYWNNQHGWEDVISYLKALGYRVLCIDRDRVAGNGWIWNHMPYGCEDLTGNIPLQKRIELLEHADFFIGLASGLSWLAWCTGIPVVMISGFSMPWHEFPTKYRVWNPTVCNGCWNDVTAKFERKYLWCPRHQGTDRQFECTRFITGKMVINTIKQLMKDNGLLAKFQK